VEIGAVQAPGPERKKLQLKNPKLQAIMNTGRYILVGFLVDESTYGSCGKTEQQGAGKLGQDKKLEGEGNQRNVNLNHEPRLSRDWRKGPPGE